MPSMNLPSTSLADRTASSPLTFRNRNVASAIARLLGCGQVGGFQGPHRFLLGVPVNRVIDLMPMYWNIARGLNSNSGLVATQFNQNDRDVFTDPNCFVLFSAN